LNTVVRSPIHPFQAAVGFWSATVLTLLLMALNIAFAIMAVRVPAGAWQGMEDYASSYQVIAFVPQTIGLFTIPAWLLMLVSLHFYADEQRKIWSLTGLLFGMAYGTLLGALYFTQVAVILPALTAGTWHELEQFTFANPRSVAWGLNHFAWSLLGVALSLVAWSFGDNRLERWLRYLFLLNGLANLLLIPAYAWEIEWLTLGIAFVSWVVALPAASVMVAILFRKHSVSANGDVQQARFSRRSFREES
jgi:hypothetical protein